MTGTIGGKQFSSWPEGLELPADTKISDNFSDSNSGSVILVANDPQVAFENLKEQFLNIGLKMQMSDSEYTSVAGGGWDISASVNRNDTVEIYWTVHNV